MSKLDQFEGAELSVDELNEVSGGIFLPIGSIVFQPIRQTANQQNNSLQLNALSGGGNTVNQGNVANQQAGHIFAF